MSGERRKAQCNADRLTPGEAAQPGGVLVRDQGSEQVEHGRAETPAGTQSRTNE